MRTRDILIVGSEEWGGQCGWELGAGHPAGVDLQQHAQGEHPDGQQVRGGVVQQGAPRLRPRPRHSGWYEFLSVSNTLENEV